MAFRFTPRTVIAGLMVVALTGCTTESEPPARTAPPAQLVQTEIASREPVSRTLERTGTLHAERQVRIGSEEEGRIRYLPFREGDTIREGEVLVRLDDALLRAELRKSEAERRQAELEYTRLTALQRERLVSEEALSQARTTLDRARAEAELLQVRLSRTRLVAPFNGVVSQRLAEVGDVVPRLAHLLTLIDPTDLVTTIQISELFIPRIAIGDPVELRVDAIDGGPFTGQIRRIHPTVDPSNRMATVDIAFDAPPEGVRPGQLARVILRSQPVERTLIPFAALRRDETGYHVFAVDDENRARKRPVLTGLHFGERVEILEGVDPGEPVVTQGFLRLADGRPVRIADR